MDTQPNTKKFVVFGIGVALLLTFLWFIWHYLHTGIIVVTTDGTNNSNVITLSTLSTNNDSKKSSGYIKQGSKQLSASVPLGKYVVSVSGKALSVNQTINLTRHKTLRYHLNAPKTSSPQPVAAATAQAVAASNSQLFYLDTSISRLRKVDTQNNLSLLSDQDLQTVKWVNTSFGIGQDNNDHLYKINNGSVSPLNVPFSYGTDGADSETSSVDFDVVSNKQIYVSNGADVYVGDQTGGFKKIYSAKTSRRVLAASNNKVAVADGPSDFGDNQKPGLAVVTDSGVVKKNISADELSWSPDGKYLALVGNGTNSQIVDTSLNQIGALPVNNGAVVGAVAWIDGNTLVYSIGNVLWSYSLNLGRASVIATLQPGTTITQMSLDENSQYLYISSQTQSGGLVSRIGLHGQTASEVAYFVSVFFPQVLNSGACSVDYINFTKITLNVKYSSNLNNCRSTLQTTLQQDGIDINQLAINYSQISAGE